MYIHIEFIYGTLRSSKVLEILQTRQSPRALRGACLVILTVIMGIQKDY